MSEHARAYGFFDGLYGRAVELPQDPTEHAAYMEGWWAGLGALAEAQPAELQEVTDDQ